MSTYIINEKTINFCDTTFGFTPEVTCGDDSYILQFLLFEYFSALIINNFFFSPTYTCIVRIKTKADIINFYLTIFRWGFLRKD